MRCQSLCTAMLSTEQMFKGFSCCLAIGQQGLLSFEHHRQGPAEKFDSLVWYFVQILLWYDLLGIVERINWAPSHELVHLRKLVKITSQCIFWPKLIRSMHHPLTTLDCDKTIAAPATCKLYLVSSENIPGNVARCRGPCQAPNKAPSGGTGALTFGSPVWEFVHPWYSCARELVQPRWKRVGGSMVWYLLALPPHPATI